jgi:hypothetical protein
MPHSRADTGFSAAARIANPVEEAKEQEEQHQHDQRHRDHAEIAGRDQRMKQRPVGKGSENPDGVAVDPTGHRIEDQQQPDCDHDCRQYRRVPDRPDHHTLDQHASQEGDDERNRKRRPERQAGIHQRPGDVG